MPDQGLGEASGLSARPQPGTNVAATPSEQPRYVVEAMKGLTPTQRRVVIAGVFSGDVTMSTVRALKQRALFYFHPTSPNGRCGDMRLTPLGVTVQGILKAKATSPSASIGGS